MGYEVERQPAIWVSKQASRRRRLVWAGLVVFFLLDGVYFALALGHHLSLTVSAFVIAALLAVKPHAERIVDSTLNWVRGAQAERAVGETLNELRANGWVVMHDIAQAGEGNIDHIVSGPTGVYLVETKERRYEDRHLTKAKRQAAKLHDELGVWVTPVICLCERDSEPFRTHGVWVVPRQHALTWLCSQRNRPVVFERLAQFADHVPPAGT